MIPVLCFTRLNQRYQENIMTCTKPCKDCKCDDSLETADLTTPLAIEMDREITRILADRKNKDLTRVSGASLIE